MDAFPIDREHPPSRVVYRDEARRFELRPWSLDDIDDAVAAIAASASELRAFMGWAHLPLTREGQFQVFRRAHADYWAGREYALGSFDATGAVLGGVGLHPRTPLNPRALEVGYWCHSAHAGRGWTTLAVRALVVLAFDRFDCDRLQVSHDEANVASQRVIDKCGFVFEGTLRNLVARSPPEWLAGGYRGTGRHRLYAMTPDDFARLDWVAAFRSHVVLFDALGAERPLFEPERRQSPSPIG